MRRALDLWNGWFDEPRSLRAVALLRILVGPIVLVHLWPFLRDALDGHYYADAFYQPWMPWLPEAPRGLYLALLGLCVLSAITLSLGLWSRPSALYTWAFVAYNLFLSQTHFHHNRAFLVINLTCLMLLPCGRLLSLDAWLARRRGQALSSLAPLWPMYLLRFEVVSVYAASGGSKLLNADWWSGLVTFDRVLRFRHKLEASVAPDWFVELITTRGFHEVFGKVAIFTELCMAAGLLHPRTRYAAVWVAIIFHVSIGIGLSVQIFSYLAISALLIWSTPSTRDRVLSVDRSRPGGRMMAMCARRLDWLARFELREHGPEVDAAVLLTQRDGQRLRGAAAARVAMSRCPLLFLPCGPLNLPGVRALWDRATAARFR